MLYTDNTGHLHVREYRDGIWQNIGVLTRWTAAEPPSYSLWAKDEAAGLFTLAIAGPTGGNHSHIQIIFITPHDGDWSQTTAFHQIDPDDAVVEERPSISSANDVHSVVYRDVNSVIFSSICHSGESTDP